VNRVLSRRFYGGEFEPKECKNILLVVHNAVEHKGKQRSKVREEALKKFLDRDPGCQKGVTGEVWGHGVRDE